MDLVAGDWLKRLEYLQGMVLGQHGAGDNLYWLGQSGVELADWKRAGGRSSSLGGRRCSDGRDVSSDQRISQIWQQQNRYSYRKQ